MNAYLTGMELSYIDFIYFCEINQMLQMYNREIPQDLTELKKWYDILESVEALKYVSGELKRVLDANPQLREQSS